MISIYAPSRLHFGLLHVPTEEATGERRFGGCGLMIDEPGLRLTVDSAGDWKDDGSRAFLFAKRLSTRPLWIQLESCPPEHVGLGVGTQLGLSIAEAVAQLLGEGHVPTEELARRAERGERSRIGLRGYREGGFWADGGHGAAATRFELPTDWRVLLARPKVEDRWHGDRERRSFARSRDADRARRLTEELSRLLETGVLPAIASRDFHAFSDALAEYNRKAGEPFAAEQGGEFNGPAVSELIRQLKSSGSAGSGQSSWGPTAFAFVPDENEGHRRLEQLRKQRPDLEYSALTRPSTGRKLQIL